MALQTDTVSLTLAASISQDTDNKQIDPTNLAASENTRVTKKYQVGKRDGLQDYPTTQASLAGANPITIGASLSRNWVEEFQGQTLLQNKGALYLRKPSGNEWDQIAFTPNLSVLEEPVASSSYTALYQDTLVSGGYRVTVTNDETFVRYSVYRIADNKYIVKDAVLRTRVSFSVVFGRPKIVATGLTFAIFAFEGDLFVYSLTPLTGALSAPVSIVTVSSQAIGFDAVYLAGSAAGDRIVVLISQSGTGVSLRAYSPALVLDATVGILNVAGSFGNDGLNTYLYAEPSLGVNRLFGFNARLTTSFAAGGVNTFNFVYDITASGWTAIRVHTNTGDIANRVRGNTQSPSVVGVVALVDAQDATKINVWWTVRDETTIAGDHQTYVLTQSTIGVPTTDLALWSYGLSVLAAPFNDTERLTTLLPVTYFDGASSINGVADFHRSRVSRRPYLTARFGEGKTRKTVPGSSTAVQTTGRSWPTASGFAFAYLATQRFISIDKNEADVGADMATVSIAANDVAVFKNNETLFVGGAQTWAYDGADVGEHGFNTTPSVPYVSLGVPLSAVVTQAGTAGLKEITTVTLKNAPLFVSSGSSTFFKLTNASGTAYYLWYQLGTSVDPAAGGTAIQVTLSADDTFLDVIRKTRARTLSGSPFGGTISVTATNETLRTITFENQAVGVSTPVSVGNSADDAAGSPLPVGTYQFAAVYSYIDSKGKKFRSRPGPAATHVIAGTSQTSVGIVLPVPDITNREYRLNEIEVYATDTNGSVFYWLSNGSAFSRLPWDGTGPRRVFANKTLPVGTSLFTTPYTSNEQLYTTGDILENDYPTGWDKSTTFKGRTVIGFPNGQRLLYSKTPASDEGLAFSDFLEIVADQDDEPIGAIGELDDKLILFKSQKKYALVGEPANDAGSGGSLSLPTLISSDTGCSEQNSLVQSSAGLFYRAPKGVYLLGRDLSDKYIGDRVEDTNSFAIARGLLSAETNEIYYFFTDSSNGLCFNYEYNLWSVWVNHQCDYASIGSRLNLVRANGRVVYAVPGQRKDVENGVSTAVTYSIELPWLKLKGQQDYLRVYDFMILGAYLSPHSLQVEIWHDYDQRDAVKQTLTILSSAVINGTGYADQTYQMKFQPMIQKCESIKIRIRDIPVSVDNAGSCTLNAVDFLVGMKKGQNKFKAEKKV